MDTPFEIFFSAGQNTKQKQALLLKNGECQSMVNVDLGSAGMIGVPKRFIALSTFSFRVHSLVQLPQGYVLAGTGTSLYFVANSSGSAQTLITAALTSSTKISASTWNGWAYVANGTDKKKFCIASPAVTYPWGVAGPTVAPTLSESTTYDDVHGVPCYYTYVAKYSEDDSEYETDVSPAGYTVRMLYVEITQSDISFDASSRTITRVAGSWLTDQFTDGPVSVTVRGSNSNDGTYDIASIDATVITITTDYSLVDEAAANSITVSSNVYRTITWTLPVSTNSEVTHKRLYRTLGGVTYFVAEVTNATTTYSDTVNDVDLPLSSLFLREDYYEPPAGIWFSVEHYGRIFAATNVESHCIYASEPYEPQAFKLDPDTLDYIYSLQVFPKGEEVTGIASFGDHLYIASRSQIKRLVGSSPTYWALRPTNAKVGNVAKYAMAVTQHGIIHVWNDGVYLFDGYSTRKITQACDDFFKLVNWSSADVIDSIWDGTQFRLFVPYGSGVTTPNRAIVVDFDDYPSSIRCFEENQAEQCGVYSSYSNDVYYAKGLTVGTRTDPAAMALELISKAFPTAGLLKMSGPAELHYEIDTRGQDLTLTFYYDNAAHGTTVTINETSRARSYTDVPFVDSRAFYFKISGSVTSAVKIYEPWIVK